MVLIVLWLISLSKTDRSLSLSLCGRYNYEIAEIESSIELFCQTFTFAMILSRKVDRNINTWIRNRSKRDI